MRWHLAHRTTYFGGKDSATVRGAGCKIRLKLMIAGIVWRCYIDSCRSAAAGLSTSLAFGGAADLFFCVDWHSWNCNQTESRFSTPVAFMTQLMAN